MKSVKAECQSYLKPRIDQIEDYMPGINPCPPKRREEEDKPEVLWEIRSCTVAEKKIMSVGKSTTWTAITVPPLTASELRVPAQWLQQRRWGSATTCRMHQGAKARSECQIFSGKTLTVTQNQKSNYMAQFKRRPRDCVHSIHQKVEKKKKILLTSSRCLQIQVCWHFKKKSDIPKSKPKII